MVTGLGMFLRAFGSNEDLGKVKKYVLVLLIFTNWLLGTYNATMCVFSISVTWFHIIVESIWLCGWSGKTFKLTFCWCTFYKWLFVVTKTPVLIISGLVQHEAVARIINHQNRWTALTEFCITLGLWLFSQKYCIEKCKFVKETLEKYGYLFFLLGFGEYIGVSYLIDILHVEFEMYALVMMGIMILMFTAFMAIIIVYMQYQWNEKEKQMILSRERILESNYVMVKQEQEINRKNIHDQRHELDYLYHCFLERDYERGCKYIENKNQEYQIKKQKEIWTGNSGVDFLINKTRNITEEKNIQFEVTVDIVEVPIAEYDFFTILGNVLENAIEASEKCEKGNRFIRLKLCTKNEIFMLYQQNSYVIEPEKKNGKFLTLKSDSHVHGWGIEIIKDIVERYDGSCSISYSNFVYSLQIMFGV